MEGTKLKLGYWKIRGLVEPARYMLAYVGADYEEVLYEQGEGPDFDRTCWTDVKPTLDLDFPNLPYMIDGDVRITESTAILRYIANKWNTDLLGKTLKDKAHVDMISYLAAEYKARASPLCYTQDDKKLVAEKRKEKIDLIIKYLGEK